MAECNKRKIWKGTTEVFKFEVNTDITGWTFYLTVKENYKDSDANAVINKEVTSHTSPANGETKITLTTSDTNLVGSYYYSFEYKDDTGNVVVIEYGKMLFKEKLRDDN